MVACTELAKGLTAGIRQSDFLVYEGVFAEDDGAGA